MKQFPSRNAERGAVLVIGLIVLMIITLMVTAAFKFSTSNLKAVGNMQARNEAIAAANKSLEQVITSWNFNTTPAANHFEVDIDNDGHATPDYIVAVGIPVCVKASANRGVADKGSECNINLDGTTSCASTTAPPSDYSVVWELDATATGTASGTTVRVRQGVSRSLSQSQCDVLCPPAPGAACR